MKTEDIDKKIGMPNVDEEWARFEREVIGEEEPKTGKRVFIGWTSGIAASIALLVGFFLWGNDKGQQTDSDNQLAQTTKVQKQEKKIAPDGEGAQEVTASNSQSHEPLGTPQGVVEDAATKTDKDYAQKNEVDKASEHLLTQTVPPASDKKEEQAPTVDNKTENIRVFSKVAQQPSFRGGYSALQDFIKQNLRYPSMAQAYGVSGKVLMQFEIDCSGSVSDAKAVKFILKYDTLLLSRESIARQTELKEQIAQLLEKECVRVISMMPRWAPGKIAGKVVSSKYYLPFIFKPSDFLENASGADSQRDIAIQDVDTALQGRIAKLDILPNSSN